MLCWVGDKRLMKQPLCSSLDKGDASTKNLHISNINAVKVIFLPYYHPYKNQPLSSFSYYPTSGPGLHTDQLPKNLRQAPSCFTTHPCCGAKSLLLVQQEGLSSSYPFLRLCGIAQHWYLILLPLSIQPLVLQLVGFQPRLIGRAPTDSWLAAFD